MPEKATPSEAQKTAFIVLGIILSLTGLISTFLFQQISKKDNDLRQRGRYLVTIQGYSETIFLTLMLYNGAFSGSMPCFIIFHASYLVLIPFVLVLTGRAWRLITRIQRNQDIYQSRFADPSDLAELTKVQGHSNKAKDRTLVSARGFSSSRTSPSLVNLTSLKSSRQQSTHTWSQQDALDQHDRVFELTHKSQQDIARSNKWYNRYKKASDRQMLITGVTYMVISVIVDLIFQFTVDEMKSTNAQCTPRIVPYLFPYITYFIFLFILSPTMIYQLNGINDGYGIRKELIWISLFSLPCIALFFGLPAIAKDFTEKYFNQVYFMVAILVAAHIPSIIIPLIRHFRANPYICLYRSRAAENTAKGKGGTGTKPGDRDQGHGRPVGASSENVSSEAGLAPPSARQQWHSGSSGHLAPPPEAKYNQPSGRDHLPLHTNLNSQQENNVGGFNLSLKNIIRNQQRNRFGFGSSSQDDTIRHIKTDWDEFIKALEDRRMFDHISAFTVAEFCAENTRFLYEVARLEKRAAQYERLRDLTSGSQDVVETVGSTTDTSTLEQLDEGAEKSANAGTRDSTIGPLPTQFASAHRLQMDDGKGSQRIKKIVSVSSVSSTMPMLGSRRSSSSLFDESEPSSPLGSSSHSTFRRYGGSSVALPDLEEGITENREAGNPSAPIHLDIINIPSTPFATLPMPPTLLIQFEYVYNTFVATGARLELNLSHETAQEIHQKAKKNDWTSGMFDGAIFEVQELLFRDVWPKFVSSSRGLLAVATEECESEPSDKFGTTSAGSRTAVFLPFDHHQLSRQHTSPSPAHSIKSPKSSLSKAASTRSTATPSNEPGSVVTSVSSSDNHATKSDTFLEEHSRTGFKTWLDKKNRGGITAATLISRESGTEESLGIIEQSRRSMVDRRSDTSGLCSNNTLNMPALTP
ncbi:MAG: hypothetical protein J3R72DRAFT_11231 [Linnemannia gamsii]|nr:MAG: hypothetical protein J3R72DRAFT_11231 [Linnemannia gamsii]